jgi:predicted NBD/HSP70 family sugar kinase
MHDGMAGRSTPRPSPHKPQRVTPPARPVCNATKDGWRRALSTVVNLLDPDVIVLGGGLSNTSKPAGASLASAATRVTFDTRANRGP